MGLPLAMNQVAETNNNNNNNDDDNNNDNKAVTRDTTSKAKTDGKLTVAHNLAGIVLSTLEQASRLAPVPYLQDAAGLAITLFDMVQTTSENKAAFQSLANDACGLVYTAVNVWKDREVENNGKAIPKDLMDHLKELLDTINDVTEFAKARASRGTFARFVSHKSDAEKIERYRTQLKGALDRFGMQSHVTIRDAVARIQDQQAAILAALEAYAPGKSPQSAPMENLPVTPNISTTPSTPHTLGSPVPSPTHPFTSFGNIANIGEATFNSINGNYVVDHSVTYAPSKNSGNVVKISTVNSKNRHVHVGGTHIKEIRSGPERSLVTGRKEVVR